MRIETICENRKELVKAMAEILGESSKYLGPPSFGYQIGGAIVDRDGNIIICQYFGKAFGNVFQFYNRLIHDFAIPFPYKIDSAKRHCQSGNSYSHQRLLFCFREILCEIDLAICDILCCLLNCTLAFI